MPRLNVTTVSSSGTLQAIDSIDSAEGFRLPSYTTAQRPTSRPDGTMIWNTTDSKIQVWSNSSWVDLSGGESNPTWATAAQRPTSGLAPGYFGYNQETQQFEVYNLDANNQAQWLTLGDVYVPSNWVIIMMTAGQKSRSTNLGNPGSSGWRNISASSTGANNRTAFGDGEGLYDGYFTATGVTKVALVNGTGNLQDPTSNSKYLVYDLVETQTASVHQTLINIDNLCQSQQLAAQNASGYTSPSVNQITGNTNGYSGTLSAQGGGWQANNGNTPDRFVYWGINTDSDDDTQALCAFDGNLANGKMDGWRGQNPNQTFWSYWGDDFHSNSNSQRIGNTSQTGPGIADSAPNNGDTVYMLGYIP